MTRSWLFASTLAAVTLIVAGSLGCGAGDPVVDGTVPGEGVRDVPPSGAGAADSFEVHVVSHGWHAGIALEPRFALRELGFPARVDSAARRVEVGWGDADYYRSPDPGLGLTLRAGLWPTASVVHVVALRASAEERFPGRPIVRFTLDASAQAELEAAIAGAFGRTDGAPIPRGDGLYRRSAFFAARGSYHLFNNCNHWTARMLRAAGIPVDPTDVLTEDQLMDQLRALGTVTVPAAGDR